MSGYYLPFGPEIDLGQPFGSNPGLGPNPPGGHNGDDWLTVTGTPVRAAGDGEVIFAGEFDSTYADNWGWNLHYGGKMVILNMDGATAPYFEYGHLSRILVQNGQRVTAGQVIALTGNTDGNTGVSTGPHCHVGCLPYNYNLGSNTYGRVNPRLYMTKHWDGTALASSGTITTPENVQEDDMPITQDDANLIAQTILGAKWNALPAATVGELLNEFRPQHLTIAGKVDGLPAKVLSEPFTRIGTDGKPSGETTLRDVIGAAEANVTISRSLVGVPTAVVVDALIAANIAEEVAALIGKKLSA